MSDRPSYFEPADERKAFEDWYAGHFDITHDPIGSERCSEVWTGWKARALSQAPAPQAEPPPPIRFTRSGPSPNGRNWNTFTVRVEDADRAEAALRAA